MAMYIPGNVLWKKQSFYLARNVPNLCLTWPND